MSRKPRSAEVTHLSRSTPASISLREWRPSRTFDAARIQKATTPWSWHLGRGLTESERHELLAAQRMIDQWLTPATNLQLGVELLGPLRAVRVSRDDGPARDLVAAQYVEALGGQPIGAIIDARVAINRGEVPGIGARFMPTPTELAEAVKQFAIEGRYERAWLDTILQLEEGTVPSEPSPKDRARVADGWRALWDEMHRDAAERSLAERAANVLRAAAEANDARARTERVSAEIERRRQNLCAAESITES
jgi:hypothetical protein